MIHIAKKLILRNSKIKPDLLFNYKNQVKNYSSIIRTLPNNLITKNKRTFSFSWKDEDEKVEAPTEKEDAKKTKSKKDTPLTKKKDTQVPLMPIPFTECPIIPKFIHVHNSYTISEDNYNELIELIRKLKSRNVAIFMRKADLDNETTEQGINIQNEETEAAKVTNETEENEEKNENDTQKEETTAEESLYQDNIYPEKKRIQYFSFLNMDSITEEQKKNIQFNDETVIDVTEKFKEQMLPVGTYGILSALQNIEKNNGQISINFMGTNRCEVVKVLEVNKLFHLIEIKHLEEDDTIDTNYKTKSKHIMGQIQTLYNTADQPTRYAIDLLKSNYDLTKPSDLFYYSLVILTLSQFTQADTLDYRKKLSEVFQLTKQEEMIDSVTDLLNVMIEESKIKKDVNKNIEELMKKQHRQDVLKMTKKYVEEQLETGKGGLKKRKLETIQKNFKELNPPTLIKDVFEEEFERLQGTDSNSADYTYALNYLEILSTVPYGKYTVDSFNLKKAREILDRDHYGMKDVKDRIMEFISIGILKGEVTGKILCFNGPPGVGKTSIAKGIAEALGRGFYRISLGGQYDTSELKGHRRTYVGSMPGKIIQGLRRTKSQNPLILLDEIDKCGSRYGQGDLSSTLLEILDFSQNDSFVDNYLDLPIDLSKTLFICTTNDTSQMSKPLLDRLEVINLQGYGEEEKLHILDNYLIKSAQDDCGLTERASQITITQEAKMNMIRYYARESGVRSLEKFTKRILEKLSYKIVLEDIQKSTDNKDSTSSTSPDNKDKNEENEEQETEQKAPDANMVQSYDEEGNAGISYPHFEVTAENLKDYLGPPRFQKERLYQNNPPGVSTGLAYTSMGGSVLYIETIFEEWMREDVIEDQTIEKDYGDKGKHEEGSEKEKPKAVHIQGLKLTGNLGKTISESSEIAYSFAKSYLSKLYKENPEWFKKNNIDPNVLLKRKVHMHFPEGATPKDGPSAGITITCALLSLALERPLIQDIGMTGEISLMGHVMQIGGLKEKLIAAKREGLKTICCPHANHYDFEDLPDEIKDGLQVNFVKTYDQVFKIAFENVFKE